MSSYFEIRCTALPPDQNFVLSKVFTRLHGIFRSENLSVGLAFPELSNTSLGEIIRVFADATVLEVVRANSGLRSLVQRRMIVVSEVLSVPQGATLVVYTRVREKEFLSEAVIQRHQRRLKRRAEARGEVWTEETEERVRQSRKDRHRRFQEESRRENSRTAETTEAPYLLVERAGRKIRLSIKATPITFQKVQSPPLFNSYGLSKAATGNLNPVYHF